jgi:hypothetical protein
LKLYLYNFFGIKWVFPMQILVPGSPKMKEIITREKLGFK